MNIAEVIQELTHEKGLDRDKVIDVICQGISGAYQKKFPDSGIVVEFNKRTNEVEVFSLKEVVSKVEDAEFEISLRQAHVIDASAELGQEIKVPMPDSVGRIDIMAAKQVIASGIRALEEESVYKEFCDKQGTLINGTVHKRERAGFAINLGEVIGFMPNSCSIPDENLKVGFSVRVYLKEVLESARGGYQLILDRASPDFLKKLLESEIPEVFERVVEVKRIVRIAGYKSKVAVSCPGREVDPVGTCVGVGGSRIKPILRELGGVEKIDLITWSENPEDLVRESLKPAQVDKVLIDEQSETATVWLAEDQRSVAIGRMGQNIALASKLSGYQISLYKPEDFKKLDVGKV